MNLFLTLIVGLFILLGSIFVFIWKNSDSFINFSVGLGLGVIASLVLLELIPESVEMIKEIYGIWGTILFMFFNIGLGFIISLVLDKFIPDHSSDNKKVSKKNYFHIAFVTSIALFIHNVLEGMVVYTSLLTSFKMGMMVSFGVAMHNIPLGMVITSFYYKANGSKSKTLWSVFLIALSTFIGGIIAYIFKNFLSNTVVLATFLNITLGLLLYISFVELLPHIVRLKEKKNSIIGLIIGVVILVVSICME